jgi:shikimate dehydrogenase
VIGTGGVGSAIAYSLCQAGVSHLVISDLSQERVEVLGELLRSAFPEIVISANPLTLKHFDLVVNASPVGMGAATDDGPMPLPSALMETLSATALVADVVTSPQVTPFSPAPDAWAARFRPGRKWPWRNWATSVISWA